MAAVAVLCVAGAGYFVTHQPPRAGVLKVRVSLGGDCAQTYSPVRLCERLRSSPLRVIVSRRRGAWSRVLVASRDGQIEADLPAGGYAIAFTWAGSGILSTRGWRPFVIASGRQTTLAPIAPVRYVFSVGPAA